MHRRLPTALLLIAGLLSAVVHAAEEPVRPPSLSVSLAGGFSTRETAYEAGATQAQRTQLSGTSPWLLRLRADWFPLRWLGIEGEGVGDFFRAVRESTRLTEPSRRGFGRLGVSARFLTNGGFLLNGSLGYGVSAAPVVRTVIGAPPSADSLLSHGPVARVGIGYTGARFEGVAGLTALFSIGNQINSIEPQLWIAGRVADLTPTTVFWVGLDVGLLLEGSPDAIGYGGGTLRFGLALKLQLLPPAPPRPVTDGLRPEGPTTLQVQVVLPDASPAVGALVTIDGAAPVAVDARGQLVSNATAGAHAVSARLSGHRETTGSAQVVTGRSTSLVLRLEALTGPGQLAGTVRASATGAPVAEAIVTVGELPPVRTGADGTYTLGSVGPGPVKVSVEAQGFTSAEEIAQVPPESAATLDVQLDALGKGSPATVRGLIRSRNGEAIEANLLIKGLGTKVQVTAEGRFFVTVPGGTYLFVITAPGYVTQTKKVVLSDGDQAIVHVDLQKASR
ncbi:MAG: carboxypeptidase regulatory-like domain-containing protein [Archangium sp.]|nr:carboxypeptidase regulatory-like domain-containing protein [Archangium sp.]MDP3570560.1 carboxypeptidase regulatory-like domain-containing protein [Archangium sp.]